VSAVTKNFRDLLLVFLENNFSSLHLSFLIAILYEHKNTKIKFNLLMLFVLLIWFDKTYDTQLV